MDRVHDMDSSRNVEIEIKLQLESFTDYLKLVGFLGSIDSEKHHENGFFDSQDARFKKGGWAVRVRAESERGLITVKSVGSHSGLAVIREEIEAEVDRGTAVEILNGYSDLMDIDCEPVRFIKKTFPKCAPSKIIQFRNDRQFKRFRIGDYDYVLEIDKTTFADGSVDYELEVEIAQRDQLEVVEDRLRKMFESLGIPFERQDRSKLARALERA